VFELGEELLDRVQIRRVFRQVEESGADGTDRATHSIGLVRAEIVHDDDVAVPQGRDRTFSMQRRKVSPLIGPSMSHGALMRSWRKAATKVMVCQRPCGTMALMR